MEQKTYTQAGYDALKNELADINERIEENKKDISTARSYGDLSENSEYDEARNEQAKVEAEIVELEKLLENVLASQKEALDAGAKMLSETLAADGLIYLFGCGHSHIRTFIFTSHHFKGFFENCIKVDFRNIRQFCIYLFV